jgi:hypothetical protein
MPPFGLKTRFFINGTLPSLETYFQDLSLLLYQPRSTDLENQEEEIGVGFAADRWKRALIKRPLLLPV